MPKAQDVAAALLDARGPMSPMELQKLLYYCQAWHLARYGRPLFPEQVEAWRQGPVVTDLWRQNRYAYVIAEIPGGDPARLTDADSDTLAWVVDKYGGFTATELSRMTHQEAPWIVTRGDLAPNRSSDRPISHELMGSFYGRQIDDPDGAVNHAVASAALEGIELDGAWREKLRDVAEGVLDADTLIGDEIARLRRD